MPYQPEDYSVGWICAIPTEYTIACELFDEEHDRSQAPRINIDHDCNAYSFGRIHEHNVIVACLPKGRYGTSSASRVARDMLRSFPKIKIGLMVGIGGGAPSSKHDIRLGDVVVSAPTPRHGGVINYQFGKAIQNQEFQETGYLAAPPTVLLTALSQLENVHRRHGHKINKTVAAAIKRNPRLRIQYSRPTPDRDRLYKSSYIHPQCLDSAKCDCLETGADSSSQENSNLICRRLRNTDEDDPVVHYGQIASADELIKDAILRDRLTVKHDVLCFEMEAAGLMDDFPCIVIRGICDYSDTHKNDDWQGYAAATAAAYAKELLEVIHGTEVQQIKPANEDQRAESSGSSEEIMSPSTQIESRIASSTSHSTKTPACSESEYGLQEFWLDGEGIDRQVLQAFIGQLLGPEALCKPMEHCGRPGYKVRAYRQFTDQMIIDLKTNSAKYRKDRENAIRLYSQAYLYSYNWQQT